MSSLKATIVPAICSQIQLGTSQFSSSWVFIIVIILWWIADEILNLRDWKFDIDYLINTIKYGSFRLGAGYHKALRLWMSDNQTVFRKVDLHGAWDRYFAAINKIIKVVRIVK